MFITFEGGEGAGKTTLMKQVEKALREKGIACFLTREPGGTPLGEHLRDTLLNPSVPFPFGSQAELMLFLASRVEHIEKVIRPALKRDQIVLCDRFNDSTIAYQGGGRELGLDYVASLCHLACRDFQPDVTFFLDLAPQKGLNRLVQAKERKEEGRLSEDRLEKEALAFHERVHEAFSFLHRKYPERIYRIDASQSPEKVFQETASFLFSRLSERSSS